jgi:hypothetical protein
MSAWKVSANYDFRRMGALLTVGAMAFFLGACAHNGGEAPALQWQFNSSDAGNPASGPAMLAVESSPLADVTGESPAEDASAVSEHGASAPACGTGGDAGWSDNCYVYRGGRDPITGRAVTQL